MRSRFVLLWFLAISQLVSPARPVSQSSSEPKNTKPKGTKAVSERANGPHLGVDQITLPLDIVDGYPFLDGSINGKKGKILLDVGEVSALTIDSHTVAPPNGTVIGHGFFGSGQTFEVLRFPVIDTVTLPAALHFEAMTNIRGNPGLPLEQHITPDFIGWIGVKFWEGYVFRLDYANAEVTFYRDDRDASAECKAEAGSQVKQTITATRAANGLLYFPFQVGNTLATGVLDTGAHDHAWMTDEDVAVLQRAGTLHEEADGNFTISGITIGGHPVPPTRIGITRGRAPFAKSLPRPDAPLYQFAFEFLSRQKTVWDYENNTITLLAP
jgi:hypothetical protein